MVFMKIGPGILHSGYKSRLTPKSETWSTGRSLSDLRTRIQKGGQEQKAYPNLSRDNPHQRDLNCPEEWP